MGLFLSTFVNKVDTKGRVSVPATFRSALAQESFQGLIAFRSYKYNAIECCSYTRMEMLSGSLDNLDMFSDEQDDLTATIFADALQLPFDGDGRIVLPKKLADFANIADRAAFVGRGATFQIWSPESFEKLQSEARERTKDRQVSVRLRPPSEKGEG
jgi:MraZ protein